jgi:hypothetical protein
MPPEADLETVIGEIQALAGIIQLQFPQLTRAEILQAAAADNPAFAAQIITRHHTLRQRAGSVIGPDLH